MNKTRVDWYGFRTQADPKRVLGALKTAFGGFGSGLDLRYRQRGWMGFATAADLVLGEMHVGLIAYGGDSQNGWVRVDLSGAGCEWVRDWETADECCGELERFQMRRVDVALDTTTAYVSHESMVQAHRAGYFNTGGRNPKMSRIEPEDPRDGRTVYVGSREQGKFVRGYEKGYELAKNFPSSFEIHTIDGVPIGDMYRVEIEFKAKDALLPDDLVSRRDQYFAGSYPYLGQVLQVDPQIFVQRRERRPQLELQASLAQIRQQYGTHLFTALIAHHGDITAVWDRIVGNRHNSELVRAGVLNVDH